MSWWIAPTVISSALVIDKIGKISEKNPFPLSTVARLFFYSWLYSATESQPVAGLGDGPYKVICRNSRESGGTYSSRRDADCAAQNIADHEDTICMVMDRWGQGHQVMRGSGRCAQRDPYPTSVPRFHPHPEHPRSRERFLRNEYQMPSW